MPYLISKTEGCWRAHRLAPTQIHPLARSLHAPTPLWRAHDLPAIGSFEVRGVADRTWVLLTRGDVKVLHNAQPVRAGLRVLEHRDALKVDEAETIYFSAEDPAQVELFESDRATCPRCRGEIARGQAVVKCPRCGVYHHQLEDRSCWTYALTCALCPQPTALSGELQWSPEGL